MLEQVGAAAAPRESVDSRDVRIMQEAISALAYSLWQSRGCPEGTADQDWFNAIEILRVDGETVDSVRQEGSGAFFTQVTLQQPEISLAEIDHDQAVQSVREIPIDIERHKLAPQL
jgi:hypothetical protein